MGRKQEKRREEHAERKREKQPVVSDEDEELLLLTFNFRNTERCDKWWQPQHVRGFNLNMWATNSLVTAGLGPVGERIQRSGQVQEPRTSLKRRWSARQRERLVRDNEMPKQRWCKASKAGILSQSVCLCLLVKVRPEKRAAPQINGVAIAGSVTNTLNWHKRFCGEDYLTLSHFFKLSAASNQTHSRFNVGNHNWRTSPSRHTL